MTNRRVAIVGGGITGLAAARLLATSGHDVTLFESTPILGGKIRQTTLGAQQLDAAADMFLTRSPEVLELVQALGLGDDIVEPAATQALVATKRGPRPLPAGLVLGVPADPVAVARSGLLTKRAMARAALDLVLPTTRYGADPSVAAVIDARMGRAVTDWLVEPLLGGVHAGMANSLSLQSTAPAVAKAARSHRSLLRAMRKAVPPAPTTHSPAFVGLRGGMTQLVEALAANCRDLGADVLTDVPVQSLNQSGDTWKVLTKQGVSDFDEVVITTPIHQARSLLHDAAPRAVKLLGSVEHASVSFVLMRFPRDAVRVPTSISGLLVPRPMGRFVTAVSFATHKWPHLVENDTDILRVSVGHALDTRHRSMSSDEVIAETVRDLPTLLDIDASQLVEADVVRWNDAFPQQRPGHAALVDAVESELLGEAAGIKLAGASYRGLGLPACVRDAQRAAAAVSRD